MSLLFRVVLSTACRSTHHRLALDALRHLRGADAERWTDLILHHYRGYLTGSKAPDDQFKDFRNHVLHVSENNWGGAISEATRWYGRTVDALRRREWSEAVYSAGVLSHYLSDPFMPLHTGQSESETQVHRALEWSISKSYGELQQIIELDLGGYPRIEAASSADWLGQMILAGAQLAHEHYQPVIDHYDLSRGVKNPLAGMDGECKHRIAICLAHAVVGYARVLEKVIEEAEVEPVAVENTLYSFLVALEAPARVVLSHFHDLTERMTIEAVLDEVQRTGKVIKNLPEDDREIRRLHAEEVLKIPLHRLDQQPAPAAGLLFGQGEGDRQHPNRLVTSPVVAEDFNRPLALRPGVTNRGSGVGSQVSGRDTSPSSSVLSTQYAVPNARRFDVPTTAASSATNPQSTIRIPQSTPPRPLPPSSPLASRLTFRLNPGSPVVDAPTIGSRTAGRLERAGVITVGDLLEADPEALAKKLNQKQFTPDVIRHWQQESSLNCRVPELYNHDAQILVASGITEPDELAAYEAQELLELITPWVKSPEAQRILRQQKPPDLAKVTQWIEWAKSARRLKAA